MFPFPGISRSDTLTLAISLPSSVRQSRAAPICLPLGPGVTPPAVLSCLRRGKECYANFVVLASPLLGGLMALRQVKCQASTLTDAPGRYRGTLPSQAISLYSTEGKRLFDEARELGTTAGFFEIATNLVTQRELTYCGLSSLVTILNALLVDPQHVWKGSWRWYDESMLVDTETLNNLDAKGLSFQDLIGLVPSDKVELQAVYATESSLSVFREHVYKSCSSDTSYILANYFRPMLGQTGAGHYSPIGAYDPAADATLLLDVARFKYPPHWVPLVDLWEAMAAKTKSTSGKSRGYMVISKP